MEAVSYIGLGLSTAALCLSVFALARRNNNLMHIAMVLLVISSTLGERVAMGRMNRLVDALERCAKAPSPSCDSAKGALF